MDFEKLKARMEEAFEKLKQEGKTDVESLIQWMKESKVITEAKESEDKARKMLSEAADKQKVEFAKFKEVLTKLAEEQKKNVQDWTNALAEQGPKFLGALQAGAAAFKDAMTKK